MSLRREQYQALLRTKQLLRDLTLPATRPKTVKELRSRVFSCLRHWPALRENGEPMFSQDPFSDE